MVPLPQVFRDVVRLLIFNNLTVSVLQQRFFNANHRRLSPPFRLPLSLSIDQTKLPALDQTEQDCDTSDEAVDGGCRDKEEALQQNQWLNQA